MTRTLIVPTVTVLIAAFVNKDILEMAHSAKVWERRPLSQYSRGAPLSPPAGSHLSLMTAHQKRTHLLMLIIVTALKRLFLKKLQFLQKFSRAHWLIVNKRTDT